MQSDPQGWDTPMHISNAYIVNKEPSSLGFDSSNTHIFNKL